jgi:UDP-N-acetylmuramoyl-tripeptide--D-alanyl-D-alanine ligase
MRQGSNHLILDAYNANPSSMKAAIDNFAKLPGEKVLILGSMAELGAGSSAEHEAIVNQIRQYDWKNVVLVGTGFGDVQHPFMQFNRSEEVLPWFQQQHFEDTRILVKGSRSMQMEKAVKG